MYHRYDGASTAVYNGAGSTSFGDLDLSSLVPEDCVVHLRVEANSTTGINLVVFRPNGNTSITRGDDSMGCHCASVGDTVGSCADAMCATTDGIVEWSSKQTYNLKIYLEGYYDCTLVDPLASGTPTITDGVATSWSSFDLSTAVGSARRLVILQASGTSSNKIAFRASDNSTDVLLRCEGGDDDSESVKQINGVSTTVVSCALTPTGTTGQVGAVSYSGATTTTIYVHAYLSDYTHHSSSLGPVSLTAVWANVDASAVVGSTDGVVVLIVNKTSLSTTQHRFAFREDGTSDDVDTTSGGAGCNRLTLSGFDDEGD